MSTQKEGSNMTVLQYLRTTLGMTGGQFMSEWKTLSEKDRNDLKAWAMSEAAVCGISIVAK